MIGVWRLKSQRSMWTPAVVVMAAEEEAHQIMDSLENVRDLRSHEDG